MDEATIWEQQTPYPSWDRETRAFAHNSANGDMRVDDMHGVLRWKQASATQPMPSPLSREDRQALAKLGLTETATIDEVKGKYRALARRYHPDANKGDRTHEARFAALTEAYDHLRGSASFAAARQGSA